MRSVTSPAGYGGSAARISFGRHALLLGCFRTERAKSDTHIKLVSPLP